jgi:hypothetical protein
VIKGLFIEWAVKVRFGVRGDESGHVVITKASAVIVDALTSQPFSFSFAASKAASSH